MLVGMTVAWVAQCGWERLLVRDGRKPDRAGRRRHDRPIGLIVLRNIKQREQATLSAARFPARDFEVVVDSAGRRARFLRCACSWATARAPPFAEHDPTCGAGGEKPLTCAPPALCRPSFCTPYCGLMLIPAGIADPCASASPRPAPSTLARRPPGPPGLAAPPCPPPAPGSRRMPRCLATGACCPASDPGGDSSCPDTDADVLGAG